MKDTGAGRRVHIVFKHGLIRQVNTQTRHASEDCLACASGLYGMIQTNVLAGPGCRLSFFAGFSGNLNSLVAKGVLNIKHLEEHHQRNRERGRHE